MEKQIAQNGKPSLMAKFADKYHVDPAKMNQTLKATAFKQGNGETVSDEQMLALVLVADQHNLNPFTKEIYAFPDRNNGVVPIVGVDGWSRIINSHPAFNGMDFEQDAESCTCIIYRKDRDHPIKVTEWMSECSRGTGPWRSHPRRMLRHKAMIQCARIAFSFTGIYDQDEAERIIEAEVTDEVRTYENEVEVLPEYPQDKFDENYPKWKQAVASESMTTGDIINKVETKYRLTNEQHARITELDMIGEEDADA